MSKLSKQVEQASCHDVTLEDVQQVFEMPFVHAAATLGISTTVFKKMCRNLGVKHWPYRRLLSLKRLLKSLSARAAHAEQKEEVKKLINDIHMYPRAKMCVPPPAVLRARQTMFKRDYKRRLADGDELRRYNKRSPEIHDEVTTCSRREAERGSGAERGEAGEIDEGEHLIFLTKEALAFLGTPTAYLL